MTYSLQKDGKFRIAKKHRDFRQHSKRMISSSKYITTTNLKTMFSEIEKNETKKTYKKFEKTYPLSHSVSWGAVLGKSQKLLISL